MLQNTLELMEPRESLGILNMSQIDLKGFLEEDGDDNKENVPSDDKFCGTSSSELNKAFLNSRKISAKSSASSATSGVPSFHSRSFEGPSKISFVGSENMNNEGSCLSALAITDPFNQAFQLAFNRDTGSSSYKSSSSDYSSPSEEQKESLASSNPPISFDEGLFCRSIKEGDLGEDSVFLRDPVRTHEETPNVCEDKSFNAEEFMLDRTPQPDFDEWNLSKSREEAKSPLTKEQVSKMINMYGIEPIGSSEKIMLKHPDRCDSPSSVDMIQNISGISRISLENSKHSDNSQQDLLILLNGVSEVIKNHYETLSTFQKTEILRVMRNVNSILPKGLSKTPSSDDSKNKSEAYSNANESVPKSSASAVKIVLTEASPESTNANKSLPYKNVSQKDTVPAAAKNRSKSMLSTSMGSSRNRSVPAASALRRGSTITQNKCRLTTADKCRKTATMKKEPLKALLPVESMAKGTKIDRKSLSLRKTPDSKLAHISKKTSTPVQEPSLKPMAASTPDPKDSNESPTTSKKPPLIRSFSYSSRLAADTKFVRASSAEASQKQRRSLPAPKEPKIYSALGKVRQNILNSPYFNPKQGPSGLPKKEVSGSKSKQEADLKMCNLELKKLSLKVSK